MSPGDAGGKTIGAVKTSFRILSALRERDGASLAELAAALDVSKPSIHHHLTTLREEGYVETEDGKYYLGLRFLSLGGIAMRRHQFLETSLGEAESLGKKVDEPVHLAVAEAGRIIFVHSSVPESARRSDVELGKTAHPLTSAAGKAIVSHLDVDEIEEYLNEYDVETDAESAAESLGTVRERKIAFDDGKQSGTVCAPVLDEDGRPMGAICASNHSGDGDEGLTDAVRTAAGVISVDTAYQSWMDISTNRNGDE